MISKSDNDYNSKIQNGSHGKHVCQVPWLPLERRMEKLRDKLEKQKA